MTDPYAPMGRAEGAGNAQQWAGETPGAAADGAPSPAAEQPAPPRSDQYGWPGQAPAADAGQRPASTPPAPGPGSDEAGHPISAGPPAQPGYPPQPDQNGYPGQPDQAGQQPQQQHGYPGQPQPDQGAYPQQPGQGGYPQQPNPGYQPQPQPEQSGYQPQPEQGGYQNQPEQGGYQAQPEQGGYQNQAGYPPPQDLTGYPGRPESGGPGQDATQGGFPGQPMSGPNGYAGPPADGATGQLTPYNQQPWAGDQPSGPAYAGAQGFPPAGGGWPPQPGAPRRHSPLTILGVVVVCVLVVASALQTVLLVRTNSTLDRERTSQSAAQARNDKRLKALEGTVGALRDRTLDSAAVAKQVLPSIFQVIAGDYTGSSFVIGSPSGGHSYLLTNDHVVQPLLDSGSKQVKLERGSSSFDATVVQHDEALDVAVLECDQKFVKLSPDPKPAEPGEPVIVIGSPLGLNDSVTTGVVSSAQRDVPDSDGKFIQFDAAINPGNSGGPVMNAKGQVVGIATEKAKDAEGIGLAIPISVPCDRYSVCQ